MLKIAFLMGRQVCVVAGESNIPNIPDHSKYTWKDAPDGFDSSTQIARLYRGAITLSPLDPYLAEQKGLTDYKIYRYLDGRPNPIRVNYKTGLDVRLPRRLTFTAGELVKVEYFAEYDGVTYNDLILQADIEYTRKDDGMVDYRTTTRRWVTENGEFGLHSKITQKRYNARMAAKEIRRRRNNILDEMLDDAVLLGIGEQIKDLFLTLNAEISSYLATGDTHLIESIKTFDAAWLDANVPTKEYTVRQSMIHQLGV